MKKMWIVMAAVAVLAGCNEKDTGGTGTSADTSAGTGSSWSRSGDTNSMPSRSPSLDTNSSSRSSSQEINK